MNAFRNDDGPATGAAAASRRYHDLTGDHRLVSRKVEAASIPRTIFEELYDGSIAGGRKAHLADPRSVSSSTLRLMTGIGTDCPFAAVQRFRLFPEVLPPCSRVAAGVFVTLSSLRAMMRRGFLVILADRRQASASQANVRRTTAAARACALPALQLQRPRRRNIAAYWPFNSNRCA